MPKPVDPLPGLPYTVVDKRELPPPLDRTPKPGIDHGTWVNLMRLLAILPTDKAIRVSLNRGWLRTSVVSSLHSAARLVGLKVNTCSDARAVYVVRVGKRPPKGLTDLGTGACRYCGERFAKKRKTQEVCGREDCQKQRVRDNNREYEARRRRKGKGKGGQAGL